MERGIYRKALVTDLPAVVALLAQDVPLPDRCRDHAMLGVHADVRNCHIKPDLVLLYRKPDADTLELVRLGTHSELEI